MIEAILPRTVVAESALADRPGERGLPAELRLVRDAVPRRRAEFVTTRRCARVALGRLGVDPEPVLSGPAGEPLWPDGVVGSLTHCDGFRAAAVGRVADVHAVGIDAEPERHLPRGVLGTVSSERERSDLARLDSDVPGLAWDTLLFSAKEAFYKAWYPGTRRRVEPEDIDIRISVEAESARDVASGARATGTFRAGLGTETVGEYLPPGFLTGRWLRTDGLLITAVVDQRTRPRGTA